ncbi:hypothetical protein M885DRAFT_551097 [Pelagophyceae sp. CCMP2097]|nr:hypothetical protein M885DRAFT_551097 [Pelagophyceae sp. CCMP2097]
MHSVMLGAGCQVHATARLVASGGPIIVGDGNLIEEHAVLENAAGSEMRIGRGNRFEVGCVVRARQIGDYNVFKARSLVEQAAVVGNGCCIGATVHVVGGTLEDHTSAWRCGDAALLRRCDHLKQLHRITALAHQAQA